MLPLINFAIFRLLDLPPELRLYIYSVVIASIRESATKSSQPSNDHFHEETPAILARERKKTLHCPHHTTSLHDLGERWRDAVHDIIHRARSKAHYRHPFNLSAREHMSSD